MDYDNTNTGVLFKNKSDNEKAPNYKGKLNVNGQELEIAAWVRQSKAGKKFLSLKVQEPRLKQEHKKEQSFEDMPDDLPF